MAPRHHTLLSQFPHTAHSSLNIHSSSSLTQTHLHSRRKTACGVEIKAQRVGRRDESTERESDKRKSLTSLFNNLLFYAFAFSVRQSVSQCAGDAHAFTRLTIWHTFDIPVWVMSVFNFVLFKQISSEELDWYRISRDWDNCISWNYNSVIANISIMEGHSTVNWNGCCTMFRPIN